MINKKNVDEIFDIVCEEMEVTREEVHGQCRDYNVQTARNCMYYLLKNYSLMSNNQIAKIMKRNSHATIISGGRKFYQELSVNKVLKRLMEKIEKKLNEEL